MAGYGDGTGLRGMKESIAEPEAAKALVLERLEGEPVEMIECSMQANAALCRVEPQTVTS